jgi:hypothetical protein
MTINFRGSTVKTYDFCAILGVNDFLGSMTLSRWFRVYGSGSMVLGRLFGSMVLSSKLLPPSELRGCRGKPSLYRLRR